MIARSVFFAYLGVARLCDKKVEWSTLTAVFCTQEHTWSTLSAYARIAAASCSLKGADRRAFLYMGSTRSGVPLGNMTSAIRFLPAMSEDDEVGKRFGYCKHLLYLKGMLGLLPTERMS